MQPVVNAATLAAARAALGVSSAATPNCGLQTGVSGVNNLDVNFTTSQVSTNQSITAASCDTVFIATGPITFTLPRANTLWNGFGFWINVVSGGVITVAINANDSIALPGQSLASGVSGTLLVNTWAYVTTDAASSGTWRIALTFADDVLHAKAYGATGNGSTDDTTALQAWINACETLSMKCFLDAGTYKTSSVLTVNAALTIEGVNRNTSIIAPSVATQDGIDVNTNAYVQFSSFAVNSSASPPTAGYCINITGPFQNQGAILRDLAFSCYNSIYMNQAAQWKIDGIFGLAQNIAITVALGGDSTIMNSNINASVIGILFQPPASAGGLRINNVKMVGASISSGVGIELLLPSAAGPSDLIISNSSIEIFQTGIYLLKNTGTTFVQINILGNEFENQNCIATDANAGWLAAVTITGNICQISGSNTGFALATGTGYDVTGNIFYGGTTGIALASGVGGIFSDNYFVSTTTNYSALSTVAIVKDAEGVAYAGLPSSAANGSQIFCSNCAPASSPCTGSSTGSTALRQNGAWKCF